MLLNRTTFTLCAGLLAATGCSRDAKPAESQASQAARERPALVESNRVAATDPVMEPRASTIYPGSEGSSEGSGKQSDDDSRDRNGSNAGAAGNTGAASGAQAKACQPDVYFETNSARLDATSRQRLDQVAECMKRREVDHATIIGQTDPSGTEQHNQELGLERAKAVAEYLRGRGVPDDQIRVESRGEMASAEKPVQLWPVARRAGVKVNK